MNEIRRRRVESLIRGKVSNLIAMGEVKDPRVDSSIALTQVKAAKDLASARIWVSSFGGEEATARAVKGLTSAAGFIQSRIGREMRMRNTPRLFFSADNALREGYEVNKLIDDVIKETC
ncbi:MAG: ribosome-binding factor A [Spirochaeta sp. LUC14_002_19_P3]|nr:MAG: ribosome-binding factor A [Spirochaeta sp. LUC14_002_19_P3]